ncbi:MAG: hypothetical protein BWK73_20235 [Thiothrix lacustris]|uniref:Uncharacterized protein n=1 Tax=Thiothrix lacustris TaxID=525917 RepID=A0A1Y1QPF8_9GAMM|nr:MAG: hypothetical protein BWK73_20235 [Thiothrix lacustris]
MLPAKIHYDHTTNTDTVRILRKAMRKHIPHGVKMVALGFKTKDAPATAKNPNSAIAAHQSLDVIGIERIEAAIGDGLPLAFLAKELRMTEGQFQSWMFSDRERAQRLARMVNGRNYMKAMQLRSDVLDYGGALSDMDLRRIKLQMQVAKDVEAAVIPPERTEKDDDGVRITFDFGSIFGMGGAATLEPPPPMKVINPM